MSDEEVCSVCGADAPYDICDGSSREGWYCTQHCPPDVLHEVLAFEIQNTAICWHYDGEEEQYPDMSQEYFGNLFASRTIRDEKSN